MQPLLSMNEVLRDIDDRHKNGDCTVGIMLANYQTPLVRQAMTRSYREWGFQTGDGFSIYWPGYATELNERTLSSRNGDDMMLVNFNTGNADVVWASDISATRSLSDRLLSLKNRNSMYFDCAAFEGAKNYIRKSTGKLRIEPLTLVLFHCVQGDRAIKAQNTICISLLQGVEDADIVETVNTYVAEISAYCQTVSAFSDLKKLEKKTQARAKRPSSSLINISEFNLIKAQAYGLKIG